MRTQHETQTQTKTLSDASPTRRLSEYEYLFSNMETTFSSPQTRTRTEQQQLQRQRQRATQEQAQNGYVPGFEGYISIAFSVHVPFWELTVDDLEQERLESLVMLFLCSQGVEMVLSTDPTTLFPVCPFNDIGSGNDIGNGNGNSNGDKALTRSAAHAVVDGGDPVVVWNLPKMDTLTLPFRAEELVRDMATNTTQSVPRAPEAPSSPLQQHYTRLNFTYPVYEWGSEDPSVRDELQLAFDTSVVETKTLDGLLPWPNAQTAPIGEEPYVFWDEPLPDEGLVYDTEIPELAGTVLRWIGVGLLALNTLVVLCLSTGARLHVCRLKKSAERRLLLLQTGSHDHHPYGGSGYGYGGGHDQQILDTEEGVSAILMESKQYALSKRSAFSAAAMAATTSVPPSPRESSLVALAKQQARERERDPNHPVGMALGDSGGGGGGHHSHSHSHSQWFAGKEATTNALGDYDEDDEEAENMMADLRILNLSSGEVVVQEAPKGAAAKAKANTKTKTKPATTKTKTTSSSVSSSKNGSTENEKDKSGGVETLKSVNLSF
eukprot:CAMPEP_0172397930 /NCGR_PEP_ID=MMETSP1061-20121228/33422_1 /TAXON_ID=37318 /ORGANISM="Pseudo-nitzschia pungens, Strain cf. pungens" /LENGTH=548 /DNA_ID=CAMNT_0013130261 /DNA_START=456 /DNA_END=2102 /DNA_ORIENTATION=+